MRLIILGRGYPPDAFIHSIRNPHIVDFMAKFRQCGPRALSTLLPTASEPARQFFDYLTSYGASCIVGACDRVQTTAPRPPRRSSCRSCRSTTNPPRSRCTSAGTSMPLSRSI